MKSVLEARRIYNTSQTRVQTDPNTYKTSVVDIVFLIGQLSCGGTERQLLLLIKSLDRTRFRPWVICLSSDASMADSLSGLDCRTFILGRPESGRLATLVRVIRLLRSIRPRILHSFGFAARLGMVASMASSQCKHVCAIRTDPQWESGWEKGLDRLALRSCDAILANSRRALTTLSEEGFGIQGRCRIIYNGLDLNSFDRALTDLRVGASHALEHTWGSSGVLCSVASLTPVKDLQNLLFAFAIVLKKRNRTELWIVGDGPLKPELQAIAGQLQIENSVRFLGPRSDVPRILRRASLGVNSSRVEGLSNAIIEYMAARLPVVATSVGGNPELIAHGQTGLLVPPGSPQKLAEAVLYVLNNPEIAGRLGEAGRRRVTESFAIEHIANETQSLYEALL